MADTPQERLARLEVQMANLTKQLEKAVESIEELTSALNQMRGGIRWALALGSATTIAVAGMWSLATWVYGTQRGH